MCCQCLDGGALSKRQQPPFHLHGHSLEISVMGNEHLAYSNILSTNLVKNITIAVNQADSVRVVIARLNLIESIYLGTLASDLLLLAIYC